MTNALASRVLFKGSRATGIEFIRNGKREEARSRKEVILSSGSLQSPQLLQLSGIGPAELLRKGIGPAELLRKHGIPVIADLSGVGENLQDHYQVRTIVKLKTGDSLNDAVRNPFKLAAMGLQWLFKNSGPLTVEEQRAAHGRRGSGRWRRLHAICAERPPGHSGQRDAALGR